MSPALATKMLGALNSLSDDLDFASPVVQYSQAVAALAANVGEPEPQVEAVLKRFSIEPRDDFFSPPSPGRREDVYPWRFGREFSLLQRPVLRRRMADADEIVWGPRQLAGAWRYYCNRLTGGSYRSANSTTRRLQGRLVKARGNAFEEQVAAIAKQMPDAFKSAMRVKKPGGVRIARPDGSDLGDIDVLVANTRKRRLWLLECKDLSRAVTPWKLRQEILNLVGSDEDPTGSIVARHLARIEWARRNQPALLECLGIQDRRTWKVVGLIVTDQELLSPLLRTSKIGIVPIARLPSALL
jgi:hypothetical protein